MENEKENEKENKPAPEIIGTVPQLSAAQRQNFETLTKIGVYKELYKRNLLTETQLSLLLQMQKKVADSTDDIEEPEPDAQHQRKRE